MSTPTQLTWLFTGTVAYKNNTLKSAATIKDKDASKVAAVRTEGDTSVYTDLKTLASLKNLLTALGYTPTSTVEPATVAGGVWRLAALTANGGVIHVAGSSDILSPSITSDALTAIKALLDADADFHTLFATTLH